MTMPDKNNLVSKYAVRICLLVFFLFFSFFISLLFFIIFYCDSKGVSFK